jgi:hypothetical protein
MHAARNGYRTARHGYLGAIVTGAALIFVGAIVFGLI